MSIHFIGVDAGGTNTRALMATADGVVVGHARGPGANGWSSGTSAAHTIAEVVREALGEHDPATVAGGVVAIAGAGSSVPAVAAEIVEGWLGLGVARPPRVVLDVVAAYAAGTVAARGLVLAAGTGSVAALVDGDAVVRRAGGRGWLVGDEGSAVWLGVEAVRAALFELDGRGPATSLTGTVREALGVTRGDAGAVAVGLTDALYAKAPAALGRLAPLVIDAAEAEDPVALGLVKAASDHLVGTAVAAADDERPRTIVLAGSVLLNAELIGLRVRERLLARWPDATVVEASSGEAGAVALAVRHHAGTPIGEGVLGRLQAGGR